MYTAFQELNNAIFFFFLKLRDLTRLKFSPLTQGKEVRVKYQFHYHKEVESALDFKSKLWFPIPLFARFMHYSKTHLFL